MDVKAIKRRRTLLVGVCPEKKSNSEPATVWLPRRAKSH